MKSLVTAKTNAPPNSAKVHRRMGRVIVVTIVRADEMSGTCGCSQAPPFSFAYFFAANRPRDSASASATASALPPNPSINVRKYTADRSDALHSIDSWAHW